MDCKDITHNGNASNDSNGINNLADVVNGAYFNKPESLNVGNIQIKDSSKVHIGPKFISINHDVTEDTLKGITEIWFINRRDWQAMPSYDAQYLSNPVKMVVFGHSARVYCNEKYKCINEVLNIQQDHLRKGYSDIGPNYLVGGDGLVFEGRGANIHGAMVHNWNSKIISIMFLGDYQICHMDNLQIENVNTLLQVLVQKNMLSDDYEIFAHCQLSPFIISPGHNVLSETHYFEHWVSQNVSMCLKQKLLSGITHEDFLTKIKSATRVKKIAFSGILLSMIASVSVIIYFSIDNNFIRYIDDDDGQTEWFIKREMWLARFYNSSNPVTHQPLKLVIINHSASIECHKFITCAAEVRSIQNYYLDKLNYDLPYNFIIGNDGRVYEGRGWYYTGAHTKYYNNCSIGLGFTGDYRKITMNTLITKKQIESTNKLLEEGVAAGHLHANYVIVGHKDIYASESPGDNLYSVMQTWEHYNNKIFKNKTCLDIDNTELDKSHNTDTTSII